MTPAVRAGAGYRGDYSRRRRSPRPTWPARPCNVRTMDVRCRPTRRADNMGGQLPADDAISIAGSLSSRGLPTRHGSVCRPERIRLCCAMWSWRRQAESALYADGRVEGTMNGAGGGGGRPTADVVSATHRRTSARGTRTAFSAGSVACSINIYFKITYMTGRAAALRPPLSRQQGADHHGTIHSRSSVSWAMHIGFPSGASIRACGHAHACCRPPLPTPRRAPRHLPAVDDGLRHAASVWSPPAPATGSPTVVDRRPASP